MGSAASADSVNVPIPHESPSHSDVDTNDAPSIGELASYS